MSGLVASGGVRLVDLTQTLSPDFPPIVLPPEMGQSRPFRMEPISRYDESGPGWYWNNLSFGEHTGTHFDAPIHWISGRDLPNNSLDTLPIETLHRAGLRDRLQRARQAPTPTSSSPSTTLRLGRSGMAASRRRWVLMRTDWSKRSDPVAYQNLDDTGQHTPGPDPDCVRFLVNERDVLGFGTETIGTDAGQAAHFTPPYPCHYYMHGAGKYGLQCLCNLDLLPPTGALIVAAPLKILEGSGSPLRVFALVPERARG